MHGTMRNANGSCGRMLHPERIYNYVELCTVMRTNETVHLCDSTGRNISGKIISIRNPEMGFDGRNWIVTIINANGQYDCPVKAS